MRKFGLIGYPLSHSFSPAYFADKFEQEKISGSYESYSIASSEMIPAILDSDVEGLNVTIPYKKSVIPFLDYLDPVAAKIGAVNTIVRIAGGLVGYNTDAYGFETSLLEQAAYAGLPRFALILGTGGASLAVAYALKNLGFSLAFVSRTTGDFLYGELDKEVISNVGLIVNTTPLGMYPNEEKYPDIPYEYISEKHLMYDLVYNPNKTLFLMKSEQAGATIMNGKRMLILQADESWKIWNSELKSTGLLPVKKL